MDKKAQLAKIFRDTAKILEIKGENIFRIRAYERAAQNLEGLTEDIETYVREGRLTQIPGIGRDLAQKITEYVTTGRLESFEELKKAIPEGILEFLNIPSVGPKTAKLLYDALKIKNVQQLQQAISEGRLKGIPGIKEKTIENILRGIELLHKGKERMNLAQAQRIAEEFLSKLKKLPEVKEISVAGSLRRRKETVRDIDILVVSLKPSSVIDSFVHLPMVGEILSQGETKSSVRTCEDIQVDCRIVPEKSYGAALLYFTGSKNFNIKIRQFAQGLGLKINEYGVFRGNRWLAGKTEEEIFRLLKMSYIEPELREDNGEIELAQSFSLPILVSPKDIKGDFHVHSRWSDGVNSIKEISEAALRLGYSYIAITDHSQGLRVARGLSIADLKKKKAEIERLNSSFSNFRIIFGAEVDIDSEGRLDYPDKVLKEFDLVIAAIHTGFKQSKEKLTRRLIGACKNRYVHILAHPTGRLWGVRPPYEIDLDELLKACRQTNTAIEINAYPDRLDINDVGARRAKELGVKLAIGTDAHSIEQLSAMEFGLAVARRAWLSAQDLLNSLSCDKFPQKST